MQSCLYFSRLGRPLLRPIPSSRTHINKPLSNPRPTAAQIRCEHNGRPKVRYTPLGDYRDGKKTPHEELRPAPVKRTSDKGEPRFKSASSSEGDGIAIRYLTGRTPTAPAVWRPSRWSHHRRAEIKTPPIALAQYLDLKGEAEKRAYWNDIKLAVPANSLPTIALHQLYTSSIPQNEWDDSDHSFRKGAVDYLRSRSLTIDDAAQWAWILSANRSDEMAKRFLSTSSEHPTFLLLEVLRKDIHYVEILKRLLLYSWNHLLVKCNQPEASTVVGQLLSATSERMHENAFTVMISRLLSQTQRIWPPAMVSVARMVPPYVQSLVDFNSQDPDNLDGAMLARVCKLNNYVLPLLALPASIEPLVSMVYNWSAQKVLLELAGQFNPPLMLDKASYKAVIQVQTASKKTERESKAATLRVRSWPPWRTEQDGMDAQRSPDDDLSRVLVATMRSKEAGYREIPHDLGMKIMGGQELDGTPTIQTRKLVKWRHEGRGCRSSVDLEPTFDQNVWAARIEATRDVREAWRAFVAFKDMGGRPNPTLYLAMFQKLNFEQARQGRESDYEAAPGDGKEVLPVPDDNMSDFFKTHTQPPRLDDLYKHMLSSGVRPSGQCLTFLVQHARTPAKGVNYLRDSGLDSAALNFLSGGHNTRIPPKKPFPEVLKDVNGPTLGAFIHLICRFAPRAVLALSKRAGMYKLEPVTRGSTGTGTELEASQTRQWCVQEVQSSSYPRLADPLHHAARLLSEEMPTFRPAWYSLFKALSRRNVVMSRKHLGGPKNDEIAWKTTGNALRNFHECGLELDPYGFILICNTFFKFGEAARHVFEEHQTTLVEGAKLLKDEFAKLSKSEESPYWVPTLLHNIKSVTLHVYMRCMGLVGDFDEIISVLEWMVRHRVELEENDAQNRNGSKMLARTLVAARISCYGTEYEDRAVELVKQVDSWQWPSDSDLERYSGGLETDRDEEEEESGPW